MQYFPNMIMYFSKLFIVHHFIVYNFFFLRIIPRNVLFNNNGIIKLKLLFLFDHDSYKYVLLM